MWMGRMEYPSRARETILKSTERLPVTIFRRTGTIGGKRSLSEEGNKPLPPKEWLLNVSEKFVSRALGERARVVYFTGVRVGEWESAPD